MVKQALAILLAAALSTGYGFAQESAQAALDAGSELLNEELGETGASNSEVVDQVIAHFQEAIRLDVELVAAYMALANAYRVRAGLELPGTERESFVRRAAETYRRALARDPNCGKCWYMLVYLEESGEEHVTLFRRALAADAEFAPPYRELARELVRTQAYEEALSVYLTYMEKSDYRGLGDASDHLLFGKELQSAGRLEPAVSVYEALLPLMEQDGAYHACRMFQRVDLAPLAEFGEFVARVEALLPYCTGFDHITRAQGLERKGNVDGAITELEKQIEANPLFPDAYLSLERLYIQVRDVQKALETLKRYAEAESNLGRRCRTIRGSYLSLYRSMDTEFVEQIREQCGL